jgi:pantoate--beta-alanine ligase
VRSARAICDLVVVTIFVNPTQFGPGDDLDCYPRDMERDLALCDREGVDLVFAPEALAIYPAGFQTTVSLGPLTKPLCGAGRPGHFDGVATVVTKLFNIVQPDKAYFGEKDFQQLQVIRRLERDLDMGIEIIPVAIVREPDGLAMSSRNKHLDSAQRTQALCLSQSLECARQLVEGGAGCEEVLREVTKIIEQAGVELEYAQLRDPETLETIEEINGPVLLALAARVGSTRLIDNRVL